MSLIFRLFRKIEVTQLFVQNTPGEIIINSPKKVLQLSLSALPLPQPGICYKCDLEFDIY
jgi:hypothetical protein